MIDKTNPYNVPDTGHTWDDNLRELVNPPPQWWMLAFWASILWVVAYSVLYPMWPLIDGYTKGIMGWTQMKEYQQGVDEVQAVRAKYEDVLAKLDAKGILANPDLTKYTEASAKVLFGDNCAACHGAGGQGNPGFPNLADDDWLYGGTIDAIQQTVTGGRKGIMPAKGGQALTEAEIDQLAKAVADGQPASAPLFTQKGCIACHGPDGKGMQALGSANLADGIWRFEPGGVESARYTITNGVNDAGSPQARNAEMPAFGKRLDATAIKKLAVYVYTRGGGQPN